MEKLDNKICVLVFFFFFEQIFFKADKYSVPCPVYYVVFCPSYWACNNESGSKILDLTYLVFYIKGRQTYVKDQIPNI